MDQKLSIRVIRLRTSLRARSRNRCDCHEQQRVAAVYKVLIGPHTVHVCGSCAIELGIRVEAALEDH